MGAPTDFSGKWKLFKNENFDEFYEKVEGMSLPARKIANLAAPEMNVEQDSNHFKVSISVMWFKNVSEFTVGEEFTFDPNQDGNNLKVCAKIIKSLGRWEGEKLVVDAKPENPETSRIVSQVTTRELNGPDETVITTKAKCKENDEEVWIKRIFKRIS